MRTNKRFKVLVDRQVLNTSRDTHTGLSILTLAKRVPAAQFGLYLKEVGSAPRRILLEEPVILTHEHQARFVTLPLDQTEG